MTKKEMIEIADLKGIDNLWYALLETLPTEQSMKKHQVNIRVLEDAMRVFIMWRSGLSELPISELAKNRSFNFAWDRGHSSGYNEIYGVLLDLVGILEAV
jgi:hypothetical protein